MFFNQLRMKKLVVWKTIFQKIFLTPILIITFLCQSFGQNSIPNDTEYLEPGYYAVVGAFKYRENAVRYSDEVDEMGEQAQYAFYPPRGFYYVQIGKFDSYQKARIKALESREKDDLDSTWVYKALPFALESGEIIGGEINMDAGVGLRYEMKMDTANIVEVYSGGSSDVAGIRSNDKIISVDDNNVAGVELTDFEVKELLHGIEGSEIKIGVMREGELIEFNLSRQDFDEAEKTLGIKFEIRNDTVFVIQVDPKGPAGSDIHIGDKLIEVGGKKIAGVNIAAAEVEESLKATENGEVKIKVMRDGVLQDYTISREELLDPKKYLGLDYVIRDDTVFITRVDKGGKADKFGIKKGDRLIEIGKDVVTGQNISDEDINMAMVEAVNKGVFVTVLRDGVEHDIFVQPRNFDVSNVAGIGIVFDIRQDTAYIKRIVAGSPSEALGLLPGDKILKVGNDFVTGTNADSKSITQKLIGAEGTLVDLTILRQDEVQEYQVERKILMVGAHIDRMDPGKFSGIIGRSFEKDIRGQALYFNTVRNNSYVEVPGQIEVINSDKVQRYATKNAHEIVGIPLSINKSGNISMISEIFGYKKIQHDINLLYPMTDMTQGFLSYEDTVLVVNFELKRYTKGDLVTMYNVYFFKDAAIMRPESRYEVNQLLIMLKENLKYKISIMGHTNGNSKGPIIEMEENSRHYFSRSGPTNESFGSAKKLSQSRADLIRSYLISKGIDANRMEAIGHGGKKSIYDKFDNLAYKNVRVEIEILQH